jgi:hypothetical protein
MSNIDNSDTNFNNVINISIIVTLFFLLILSFKYADVSFISVHPNKFLTEVLLCGLFAAIPFIAIGLKRHATNKQIAKVVFIVFIFFYLFSTLVEFSGLNTYLNNVNIDVSPSIKKLSPSSSISTPIKLNKKFEYTELEKSLLAITIIIIIVIGYLAYSIHDWPTYLRNKDIIIEIAIFTILNTIPQIIISSNRNSSLDNVAKRLIVSVVYYALMYGILQSGGFFTNIFSNTTDRENLEELNLSEISTSSL